MEQDVQKKVNPTEAIIRMIISVNAGREGDFYKIAEEFSESLAHNGGNRWKVKNALRQKPMRMKLLDEMPHSLKGLLISGKKPVENVYLSPEVNEFVKTILSEWKHKAVYDMHKIPVRNKILLHGPTGNGKTTIARYIAQRSELPFIEVNADTVIDSKLGSSSYNINQILNSIKEPCILFWDEIDSVGCKRGVKDGSAAGHENDRMTNSLLTNMERLEDVVILIGATNRIDVLDSAFLRRFDAKIEIPAPSQLDKDQFIDQLLLHHSLPTNSRQMQDLHELDSFSEIKTKVMELGRSYLLSLHQNDAKCLELH